MKNYWKIIVFSLIAIVVVVVVVVAGAAYYATGTPVYSLYVLRKALREQDRDQFYHHFDVRRVVEHTVEQKVSPTIKSYLPLMGRDTALDLAESIVRRKIDERLAHPESISFGKMTLASINQQGKTAQVTLRNPKDDSTTVVGMEQMSDRHWKIVEIDLSQADASVSPEELLQGTRKN
ncbi:MAG: hypothetical protein HY774_09445 [Acidobacteria bacterium]|nr:hypothetical protein [Acidobacteriota bacterium]